MNALELLKNVQEFQIGDWVVSDNALYQIVDLPRFSYITRYTDGDWEQYFVDTYEEIERAEWEFVGYYVCTFDKSDKKLKRDSHKLFGVRYELFSPDLHPNLIKIKEKMEALYSIEKLEEEENGEDE